MAILYISNNDGTDTRIKKEIKTISNSDDVYFIGNGSNCEQNAELNILCKEYKLLQSRRNTFSSILFSYLWIIKYLISGKITSVHVVNEQLMIFYYPLMFFKHSVLDIFDSVFLKYNKPGNQLWLLKFICYYPINVIIVTDRRRFHLMPDFAKDKVVILPNYPRHVSHSHEKNQQRDGLSIFYGGTLTIARGTKILEELCKLYPEELTVFVAGWVHDKQTEQFLRHDCVVNLGLLTQEETLSFVYDNCDYIMCLYEPNNINNINASPNKIYDALQSRTPLIINSEILVSEFVKEEKLGLVLDTFHVQDYVFLFQELVRNRKSYKFIDKNVLKYTWNNIEERLLAAHKLK